MKLERHVLTALDAFDRGDKEDSLLHATIAIEGTAKKLFQKGGKKCYKECIRQYWWLVERFIGEGLNLEDTKFTYLKIDDGYGEFIQDPDFADIIYHIFRCSHAHAEPVPLHYELLSSTDGKYPWLLDRKNNSVRMPDTVIFALLGISVFCKANADIVTNSEHFLSWGNSDIGVKVFKIKDYWGKEDEIKKFFSDKPQTRVKIDFKNWKR